MTNETAWPEKQSHLFEMRYADWLTARADLQRSEAARARGLSDEDHDAATVRLQEATQLACTTHVTQEWMILAKFEMLERALVENEDGGWADVRPVWMLACIKANIMALGVGPADAD